jgi:hypothetical protein
MLTKTIPAIVTLQNTSSDSKRSLGETDIFGSLLV